MNTIEIRTHIEPDSDGQGNSTLMTMIFIDDEPLFTTGYAIDMNALDQSTRNDGRFFIIACPCGDAGCAIIEEGVRVLRDDQGLHWEIEEREPPRSFVFEQGAYEEAIERGISELRDLYDKHQIGTIPVTNEWYLEKIRKAWRWMPTTHCLRTR